MSKVAYNQTGYFGSSMSLRAVEAYDCGEMPKSKWTKQLMLQTIKAFCCDAEIDTKLNFKQRFEAIKKLKKDEIWREFFEWKSWHHTSKFANETDFYGVDEDALTNFFVEEKCVEVKALIEQVEALEAAATRILKLAQVRFERATELSDVKTQNDEARKMKLAFNRVMNDINYDVKEKQRADRYAEHDRQVCDELCDFFLNLEFVKKNESCLTGNFYHSKAAAEHIKAMTHIHPTQFKLKSTKNDNVLVFVNELNGKYRNISKNS